jgi:hypothetical protein
VKNTEGRCGMVALTLLPGEVIDWKSFSAYVVKNLPAFARPYFVRIRNEKDATSSFKQVKMGLQKEGFDPSTVKDPMYFLDPVNNFYVELTKKIFEKIESGLVKF